jgi:hypothetical protein
MAQIHNFFYCVLDTCCKYHLNSVCMLRIPWLFVLIGYQVTVIVDGYEHQCS